MEEILTPARSGMKPRRRRARPVPCQGAVCSSMSSIDGITAVASEACTERRRAVQANHHVDDDGSSARAPRTDMPPACLQQRTGSGARAGRHGAAGADVFGQKTCAQSHEEIGQMIFPQDGPLFFGSLCDVAMGQWGDGAMGRWGGVALGQWGSGAMSRWASVAAALSLPS